MRKRRGARGIPALHIGHRGRPDCYRVSVRQDLRPAPFPAAGQSICPRGARTPFRERGRRAGPGGRGCRDRALEPGFFGRDRPTNVLSFPETDGVPARGASVAGDIVVSAPTCLSETGDGRRRRRRAFSSSSSTASSTSRGTTTRAAARRRAGCAGRNWRCTVGSSTRKAGGGPVEPPGPGGTFLTGALFVLSYALGTPGYDVPGLPLVCLARSWRSRVRPARRGRPPGGDGSRERPAASPSTTGSPTPSRCRGSWAGRSGALAAFLVSAYVGAYFSVAAAAARRLEGRFGERGLGCSPSSGPPSRWPEATFSPGSPGCSSGTPSRGARRCARRRTWREFTVSPSSSLSRASPSTSRGGGCPIVSGAKAAIPLIPGIAAILFLFCTVGPVRRTRRVPRPGSRGEGGHRPGRDRPVREVGAGEPVGHARDLRGADAKARDAGAQVVVWPETAAPFFYGWEAELSRRLDAIAVSGGIPSLRARGTIPRGLEILQQRLPDGRARRRLGGTTSGTWCCSGQTFPCVWSSFSEQADGGRGGLRPGPSGTVPGRRRAGGRVDTRRGVISGVVPGRGPRRRDAAVNVTNDAWFGDTVAPTSTLPWPGCGAVEFRRPMVRAANSGISAIIDGDGASSSPSASSAGGCSSPRSGRLPKKPSTQKPGEIFGISCSIFTLLAFIYPLRGSHGIRIDGRENIGA